ncbi:MAG TPA: T9SS type A sorting domain-containing protein [Ignavibacteria bacterium]
MENKRKSKPKLQRHGILVILMILLFAMLSIIFLDTIGKERNNLAEQSKEFTNEAGNENKSKGKEGPLLDVEYFKQWNYPYGMSFPNDVFSRMWNEVKYLPSENELNDQIVNSWRCIGPYGMVDNNSPARYTGRILDIEVGITNNILVASASGGLWGFFGFIPIPLSDDLNCLSIGSFDTHPNDPNIILLGTGEYYVGTPSYQKTGTGLYKTTNGGNIWTHITMNPEPQGFSQIRYLHSNPNIVYAATVDGFYRSSNAGNSWTRLLSSSNCFSFDISSANPNLIYLGRYGALLKSTNAGINFSAVSTPGFPTLNVGRVTVAMGINSPNFIYCAISNDLDDHMLGIFRSVDNGVSWTDVSPPENIFGNQGWYNDELGVCPTDANLVLAGGIRLWRTTNGGAYWSEIVDDDVHADQHAIEWKNSTTVYAGNDGGLTYSTDAGVSWTSPSNTFPITQYITINAGVNNRGVIYGGSRDNGLSGTTNGGLNWKQTRAGDGGGIYVDPYAGQNIYATNGYYTGDWAFKRYKTTNYGVNWADLNNTDIEPSDQFYTKMRGDKNVPPTLYTNSGPYVYFSTNFGNNWQKLNNIPFSASTLLNFTVSKYSGSTGAAVYACLNQNPPSSINKLKVYDNGTWYERSAGFPYNQNVRVAAVHQQNPNLAYALINGVGTPGQKIYKTTNRGINWANISGDIPDVPMGDLVPHPTDNNKLYLGTQLGCYRSTNAGQNWHRWNNGIPDATVITEMSYVDSTIINNKFYVVIGTYGRSIWVRDISGDDPIGITQIGSNVPKRFSLEQNYPNPFNPATNIKFALPKSSFIRIIIYDLNGREVETIVNNTLEAGYYNIDWNGNNYASGVYFYKLVTDGFVETKKMVLVK